MAVRNKYYCIVGIDHESISWDPTIPYSLEARLYDIDTAQLLGETRMRLAEQGKNNLEEALDQWTQGLLGQICYQFMLFPGVSIKAGDICRILVNRAPTLTCRNYASGHHHKLTIFDKGKYVKWKVVPDVLWDFKFSSDTEQNKVEFDKFCSFMIDKVGIQDFCKKNTTSMQMVRRSLVLEEEDINHVPDSAVVLEQEYGMNSGGRMLASHAYEVIPVVGIDVNSLYTEVLLEDKFSKTRLRKVTPLQGYDYTQKWVWDTYIKTLDSMYGEGEWQLRIICDVEDAVIRNTDNPMSMHDSMFIKRMAPDIRPKGVKLPRFTGSMMFFISELQEFVEKYNVKKLVPRLMLCTFCGKFSRSLREKAYSLFRDSKDKKKDPHLAAVSKIQKNALAGFFQMNPAKYTKAGKDYDAKVAEVNQLLRSERFPNILAGAELTLHGREHHRRLQEFFESRDLEVVYGNTDSLYIAATDETTRARIYETIKEWNKKSYSRLKRHCGDFTNWVDMHPANAIGSVKVEHDGYIIHGGVNNIFKAGRDGVIIGGSISGYNWSDILHDGESRSIWDMKKGRVIPNVYQKVESNNCTQVVLTEWRF